MFVCSLGSGSSGNAIVVRGAANFTVLIDCGVQFPRLIRNLARLGIRPDELSAIVLSHEHSDHTQAVPFLRESWHIPVIADASTMHTTVLAGYVTAPFQADQQVIIGDMVITPCAVSHDAQATYGFVVEADGCSVAIFTDLGHGTDTVRAAMRVADLIVIEANYDDEMLENGSYPWFLKARIKGRGGHLSNVECARLLTESLTGDRPRDVWLAHLSKNNNTPERAYETVSTALHDAGFAQTSVTALPRYTNGPIWEATRHRQLTLF